MINLKKSFPFFAILLFYLTVQCNADATLDLLDAGSPSDYVDPHSFYYDKHSKQELKREFQNSPNYKSSPSDYVDPHSFYYNKQSKQKLKTEFQYSPNYKQQGSNNQECNQIFDNCLRDSKDVPDEFFSRRLINKLLTIADFEENEYLFTSSIVFQVTKAELKSLRNFGLGKLTIRDIDPIISNAFRSPDRNIVVDILSVVRDTIEPLTSTLWFEKEMFLGFVVLLFITWMLVRSKYFWPKLLITSFTVMFAVSFFITWLKLLKEAEIKYTTKQFMHAEKPAQCEPHKMSWWQKMSTLFISSDECEKYFEAKMENPILHVTPAQVLSNMLGTFFLDQISMAGSAFGNFVNNSTQHMPILAQIFMQPILIFVLLLLLLIGIVIVLGGSFKLGAGPFSFLTLRGRDSSQDTQSISSKASREPIEIINKLQLNLQVQLPDGENSSKGLFIEYKPNDKNQTITSTENNPGQLKLIKDDPVSSNISPAPSTSSESNEISDYEIIMPHSPSASSMNL